MLGTPEECCIIESLMANPSIYTSLDCNKILNFSILQEYELVQELFFEQFVGWDSPEIAAHCNSAE